MTENERHALIGRRIARVREMLDEHCCDAFMFLAPENRRYLSGFTAKDTQMDESSGALFVTRKMLLLATDGRYVTQARQECPGCRVFQYKTGLGKSFPDILDELDVDSVGFEDQCMSVRQHTQIAEAVGESDREAILKPVRDVVEKIRIIKEPGEIAAMRKSLKIAEDALREVLPRIRPGMTEKQIAWEMEKAMREAGADEPSFDTIVASGRNAALPHAVPTDKPVKEGEPLLFDWGAYVDGYASDISRTVILGAPDKTFIRIFELVQEAQARATEAIKPGMAARDVDRAARDLIEENGYANEFNHGLGHGVGLAVHEAPRVSFLSDAVLSEGMIFTVEPGIYLPDWGGVRLENMALVTETGAETLNSLEVKLF